MRIGLDIGYSAVKVVSGQRRASFPTAIGTVDKARFSVNSHEGALILVEPEHVQVGDAAIAQSRFVRRREDRAWVESGEWYNLFLVALTESTAAKRADLMIVTGLPVAYFEGDRGVVRERLSGEHGVQREGRHRQSLTVIDVKVVPQPFGTLLAATLNDRGGVADLDLARGAIGVVDAGGKTTNLLSVNRLTEINRETASVGVGAWDAVRALRGILSTECPDLDLRDHQVIGAIIARQIKYFGQPVDLAGMVDDILEPLANQIIAEASQLWNGGAGLDAILVSGGGALLLGPYIKRHFRHARIVDEPVFANALGFYRFAEYLGRK